MDIGRITYPSALRLAGRIRALAVAVLALGLFAATFYFMADAKTLAEVGVTEQDSVTVGVTVLLTLGIASALLAAVGHVLEILVGIYGQVFDSRFDDED